MRSTVIRHTEASMHLKEASMHHNDEIYPSIRHWGGFLILRRRLCTIRRGVCTIGRNLSIIRKGPLHHKERSTGVYVIRKGPLHHRDGPMHHKERHIGTSLCIIRRGLRVYTS